MDSYFIIILGLGVDLIGAVLIISPILSLNMTSLDRKARMWARASDGQNAPKKNLQIKLAFAGVSFLVVGFLLQIVGNYIQYLQSLE